MSHSKAAVYALLVLALIGATPMAQAQCSVTKDQMTALLAQGYTETQLYSLYGTCSANDPLPPGGVCIENGGTFNAAGDPAAEKSGDDQLMDALNPWTPTTQIITNTGSVFYEALTSCGYHPQKKQAACAIEIRQRFGFGGMPGGGPGSNEHVLFCVDLGAGLVPINIGSVHLHDERFGVPPRWYFAALIPANTALASRPLDGTTYGARAILSWLWAPTNCNFRPVWGNQIDFRIRLDP